MEKQIKITLIIAGTLIALALLATYTIFQTSPLAQANTITSNGFSEISIVPDKVGVYFSVETKGLDSKAANDLNSEIVDDLITALVKEGFERKDIQTTGFNIYEEFEWINNKRKSVGWKAVHSVIVQMSTSQSDKIGKAIDAGIDAGATVSHINFELSQELENQYKAEAIKLASEDAKVKAEAMVEGQGRKLGRLVSISDSSFNYYPWRAYDYALSSSTDENIELAKAATSIQPGERKISAQVSVGYKIK